MIKLKLKTQGQTKTKAKQPKDCCIQRPLLAYEDVYFGIWRRLDPVVSYSAGIDFDRGLLARRSDNDLQQLREAIHELADKSLPVSLMGVLESQLFNLDYEEPSNPLMTLSSAFRVHRLKQRGRIAQSDLQALALQGVELLDNCRQRLLRIGPWSLALRFFVQLTADSVRAAIGQWFDAVAQPAIRDAGLSLLSAVERYAEAFAVSRWPRRGDVSAALLSPFQLAQLVFVSPRTSEDRSWMGTHRGQAYAKVLSQRFALPLSASELLSNGLMWLREEMARIQPSLEKLSERYGVPCTLEAVRARVFGHVAVAAKQLKANAKLRARLLPFFDRHLVSVPPEYLERVHVKQQASSLVSGQAEVLNQLSCDKVALYFSINGVLSVPEMFRVWVHEELGHDLHFYRVSSSDVAPFHARLSNSFESALTEGLSFHRELQALHAVLRNGIAHELGIDEATEQRLLQQLEFSVRDGRILRFLRLIGDVLINTNSMTVFQFLRWAHDNVGVNEATLYEQFFPAHELAGPAYAAVYAAIGQHIGAIQKTFALDQDERKLRAWNDRMLKIGFLPPRVFLDELQSYAVSISVTGQ